MKKKNRKKGVSLVELVIVVAILAILVSIIGPIARYFLRLGGSYSNGLLEKTELDGTYRKLEEIIGSISMDDKWGNLSTGTKNMGIGIRDNFDASLDIKLGDIQGNIMSSNGQAKRQGNTLYVMIPVYNNGILRQAFHTFRFVNVGGQTGLYYSNSVETDGSVNYLIKQNKVPFKSEELYLPSGAGIQELVPNSSGSSDKNYFVEVGGGVFMHIEYYKEPNKVSGKNDPDNIIKVEKLFLKRGEV